MFFSICFINTYSIKKQCKLKGKIGCKNSCSLVANHKGDCICSSGANGHLCSKMCYYAQKTRKGCTQKCILIYSHSEKQNCICSAPIEEHIHKGVCHLKDKTKENYCSGNCIFCVNHSGPCFCARFIPETIRSTTGATRGRAASTASTARLSSPLRQ